ncbi:response regulator transcription factor [Leptolyngbya sp. NK1-12]|uniref:Response regulator transcription factor n=1 Tax=Leptolyngbya sp. NK1-12 TaxID=2547451 RepID=A0AA96WL72_9CYAN|nr:two-component system response regulator RppA [Leptolyngbya sp. NK1-12]WNZ27638.1 response regulator transcription factor [Leptolyngbya sp. NK1-12]
MRILLVEDDPEQSEPLYAALTRSGHIVDAVEDGTTAQWLIGEKGYDLLILDWMLPGEDGIVLCQHYRQAGKTAPILMLTAKDTTADKVMGLDAGADDYLVKPVDIVELLARVRALRRRSPHWCGDTLKVADLSLHLDTMRLTRGSDSLKLASRDFQLLEYMMRHPCQILTHDQIEQALWEWEAEPESNAVASRIKRLRQRLREIGIDTWIETVYGIGYRLEPPAP